MSIWQSWICSYRTSSATAPRCTKDGYTQKSFGVRNSFNDVTIVNVLILA
ncbi:MAG: hypothetical protein AB8U25_06585 [Rickettsiales endosymbiont of Dermacentor nuttalli]